MSSKCPIIGKLPDLKLTGDCAVDDDMKLQRGAFICFGEKLWENPKHSLAADAWLKARFESEEQ